MTSNSDQAVLERAGVQGRSLFPIDMAVASYDRTRPILDGHVKPAGIALNVVSRYIGEFCEKPVYEEYDVAEMSFSWYVTARSRGEPVMALPVFPLRMPVLAYVFVRADAPYTQPRDLIGKRIGVPGYRYTVNLWLRGIFRDHYGLAPEQATWITCQAEEGAGYSIPSGIKVVVADGATPEQLLRNGDVDAILVPKVLASFVDGTSGFRRLFRDPQAEVQSYTRRSGILPITHTIVMKQSLTEQEPWISESLFNAFRDAQRMSDDASQFDPKFLSMADAIFYQEQDRAAYGARSWSHGVAPNRRVIETFLRYAHEQGYSDRLLSVEELFPANTIIL
jgi:4,5-dihydroxyphthalate decarboxylase